MKILFLNGNVPNYVTDGLFHGLRSLSGITVVDTPRMDYMYTDAHQGDLIKTGSRGNTLYKMLEESSKALGKRTFWQVDLEDYDIIIFTDMYWQSELYNLIYKTIKPEKRKSLCIIDGNDTTAIFPYYNRARNLRERPWVYFLNFRSANYFKREYHDVPSLYGFPKNEYPIINKITAKLVKSPINVFPISMSIPEEHIEHVPMKDKIQDFVNYNIDPDLKNLFPAQPASEIGSWKPTFENQGDYYQNIRESRFGITVKRAGWDCLRHYEYAAKGAILCFKDFDSKVKKCAPHGLDSSNCIPYKNEEDLLCKLRNKSALELQDIQGNQYLWIKQFTTKAVATKFLENISQKKGLGHL